MLSREIGVSSNLVSYGYIHIYPTIYLYLIAIEVCYPDGYIKAFIPLFFSFQLRYFDERL